MQLQLSFDLRRPDFASAVPGALYAATLEGDAFYLFTDDCDLATLDARVGGIHDGHLASPATPGIYPAGLH
jgi:hypothetical protein